MAKLIDTGALTEKELFERVREHCCLAAEACEKMARGERGTLYIEMCAHIKILEDCCRFIAAGPNGRGDYSWLAFGKKCEEVHKRAGDWLRARDPSWRFGGLAQILRRVEETARKKRDKKVGTFGPIVPEALPGPLRENKPVQIILPDGYQRVH